MTLPEKIADNELEVNQDLIDDFMEREHWRMAPGNFWYSYHNDWNMLMVVVGKIESIRHIGIDAIYFQIKGKTCQIWTYFDVKEFLRLTGDDKNDSNKFKVGHTAKTKIEAVYHAVIDFIKWYNSKERQQTKH